jgi:voltage-gated potassium channel
VPITGLIERRTARFMRQPASVRNAASIIVTATAIVVVLGGVAMRLLDHSEYPNVWKGMWWSLQTVTTVGYGDVTPANRSGRFVGAIVMLEGIAFLTILVAAITSTFLARAERERATAEAAVDERDQKHVDARFDDLDERLARIEATLARLSGD